MTDDNPVTERPIAIDDLLNTAPCGFLSFRDDGTVVAINATLLELLGYDRDEVVGRHVETLLTLGTRIFYQTHWFPLLRLHGSAEEIFLMLRSKAGEHVGVLINAVRREREGDAVYDCILMRVRQRQKYEDELLRAKAAADEANRAKSAFLAVMSHELRTPLNAIAGYTELIEMGIHGPVTDQQKKALSRIQRSQRHLLRLINDILNLARIESGRVEYAIADLSLAQVVKDVMPLVEPQLKAKELDFESTVAATEKVRADPDKLQQILLNLLSNAIKFTPRGGRISVTSSVNDVAPGMVSLFLADTGIGIPPEKLGSVFEPFVQLDAAGSGAKQGTGLGLAISRDLARGMGGDLHASSREGQGSTFTLTLPRAVNAS